MRYYVLFSSDGESAEGDFEYHSTLGEAIRAAKEISGSDPSRTADEYFIRATDPTTEPETIIDYDIDGNEI